MNMTILLGAISIVATFAFSSAVLADDVKKDDLKKPAAK